MDASLTFTENLPEIVKWKFPLENSEYNIPHPTTFGVSAAFTYHPQPKLSYTTLKWLEKNNHLINKSRKRKKIMEGKNSPWKAKVSGPQIYAALQIMSRFEKTFEDSLGNEYRCGAFLGDQMGCGKTRVIALIIAETASIVPQGKLKCLWLSAKPQLQPDAEKELREIDCSLQFITNDSSPEASKGIIFAAYSSLSRGNDHNRLFGIAKWLDEECLMIFDESHLCRNDTNCSTATKWLQRMFPKARVLYVTATVGTEPNHMLHMERLGLWGKTSPFRNKAQFKKDSAEFGLAGLEFISHYLTAQGSFIARELMQEDVTYENYTVNLTEEQRRITRMSVIVWQALFKFVEFLANEDQTNLNKSRDLKDGTDTGTAKKLKNDKFKLMRYYWGAHQRFFASLILSFKAPVIQELTKAYPSDTHSFVISVQCTGYSGWVRSDTKESVEYSPCRETLKHCLEHYKVYLDKSPNLQSSSSTLDLTNSDTKECLKKLVMEFYGNVQANLPGCPLNEIINYLGGHQNVAEITGRKSMQEKRLEQTEYGNSLSDSDEDSDDLSHDDDVKYENRQLHLGVVEEARKFQMGEKNTIIISQRGGIGLSLHSDADIPNVKKRVHVIMELPWIPELAKQQLGRTHRTNQRYPPHYVLVSTDIPGELRFFQTYYERLNKMGALCQGSRNGTSDKMHHIPNLLSEFPAVANEAAHEVVNSIETSETPDQATKELKAALQNVDLRTQSQHINKITSKKEKLNLQRVLNRSLGLHLEHQEIIVNQITRKYKSLVEERMREDKLDTGIKELTYSWKLKQIDQICFDSKGTNLACKLLKLSVDKGQSFEELYVKFKEEGIKSGAFYIQNDLISFCKPKRMKIGWDGEPSTDPATYDICTPWKCNMSEISYLHLEGWEKKEYSECDDVERIKKLWNNMFHLEHLDDTHEHYKRKLMGPYGEVLKFDEQLPPESRKDKQDLGIFKCSPCEKSLTNPFRPRKTTLTVVTGCLLFVLKTVLTTFANGCGKNTAKLRPQILKLNVECPDGKTEKMVGIAIPSEKVPRIKDALNYLYCEKTPDQEASLIEKDLSDKREELSNFKKIQDAWEEEKKKPVQTNQRNDLSEKIPVFNTLQDGLLLKISKNVSQDGPCLTTLRLDPGEKFMHSELELSEDESISDD